MRNTLPMLADGFREFDRLFDDFVSRDLPWSRLMNRSPMNYDIIQKADVYEVTVDLPGVKAEDVRIDLDGSVLRIEAERKSEERNESDTILVNNRYYGKISNSFSLNNDIDPDQIQAHFENGTLKISLKKKSISETRRIPLATSNSESRKLKTA